MKTISRSKFPVYVLGLALALGFTISGDKPALAATFNVKNFGAVGDGVTDDTAAIKAAIAAAQSSSHGNVLFPGGSYLYSSQLLSSGITFTGQGGATLLSQGSAADLTISGASPAIHNLTFSTLAPGGIAVAVTSTATNYQIEQNTFNSGFNTDIGVLNAPNGTVAFNQFNVSKQGIFIDGSLGNAVVQNNNFSSQVPKANGITVELSNNVTVNRNNFSSLQVAILLEGNTGVTCSSNNATNCIGGIGSIKNQNINENNNRLSGTGAQGQSLGFESESDQNIVISQNIVQNFQTGMEFISDTNCQAIANGVTNTSIGIGAEKSTTVSFTANRIETAVQAVITSQSTNVTINQNFIQGASGYGLISEKCLGSMAIVNNKFNNCGLQPFGPGNPAAVILVDCPGASSISITKNSYTGNSTNLSYFIDCLQTFAQAFANKTNTMLPNLIG